MATNVLEIFKNEDRVRQIGGKLEEDYYLFRNDVEYINDYFYDLFYTLGLTDNMELIIYTLNKGLINLRSVFVSKTLKDLESGKIERGKFLSERMRKKVETLSPEARVKVEHRENVRNLNMLYKKILDGYLKEYKLFSLETRHSKRSLELFGHTLFATSSRIEIDVIKFVDSYKSYMEASESKIKRLHDNAAAAMNKFFNGMIITQKELSRYFIIKNGRIEANPKSVKILDYSRLGKRTYTITVIDDGNKKQKK